MKRFSWILVVCLAVPFMAPAADEESETIPQKELRDLLKGDNNVAGPAGEVIFSMTPEEKTKLRELSQTDRDAARKMILDKIEANKQARMEANQKIRDAAKLYRECSDDAQKETLRADLRKLLAEQFERTSAEAAARLKVLEMRLAVVRKAYEERQANSQQMIDSQLEKLTQMRKHQPGEGKKEGGKKGKKGQQETPAENVQ